MKTYRSDSAVSAPTVVSEAPATQSSSNSAALEQLAPAHEEAVETSWLDGLDTRAAVGDAGLDAAPAGPDLDGNYRDVHRKHAALASGLRRDTTSERTEDYQEEIAAFKVQYEENKERYEALGEKHGLPPALIAALHKREADGSFDKYLAQGAKLGSDPRAQGMAPYHKPMNDWDEAADWALDAKKHHADELELTSDTRDPALLATYAEMYNGLGYHGRNMPSGYIYAGTDAYQGGHFTEDGKLDAEGTSAQPGILALMDAVGAVDGLDLDSKEARSRDEEWSRLRYGANHLDAKSSGEPVAALQERLLGADGATGEMDAATLKALHGMQKDAGIEQRDQVGNPEIRNLIAGELWAEMTQEDGALKIGNGSSGLSAQLVQQELIQRGELSGKVDGMFGPKSSAALKKAGGIAALEPDATFAMHTPDEETVTAQDAANAPRSVLVPDADVAPVSIEQQNPIPEDQIFKRGAEGAAVESIQRLLGGGLTADGKLGRDTDRAIRAFQRQHGLKADGKVGPRTRAALYAANKVELPKPPSPTKAIPAPPAQEDGHVGAAPPEVEAEEDVKVGGTPRDHAEIDAILAEDWGTRTFDRDSSSKSQAIRLQTALKSLGYLPADTVIDGSFGPSTTNALMAFQVATSGVDTVEKGTDAKGNPIYSKDGDRNRLQGKVDGRVGPGTVAALKAALEAERTHRINGTEEDTASFQRSMGDTPEQKKQIAERLTAAGLDPATVMSIDTSRFSKLGLRPHVLDAAIDAWENQFASGRITNTVITVNDFELPDNMRRSFTLDLSKPEAGLQLQEMMAHGSGTGGGRWARNFARSQQDKSKQSILGGSVVGARAYPGSKQYGATVDGLEPGINDRADARLIRTHAREVGTLSEDSIGRDMSYKSWGCMVLRDEVAREYRDDAREEGGRYNFNFAPHEHYWGKNNDVTKD